MKNTSVFYGQKYRSSAADNIARYPWAKTIQDEIIAEAEAWLRMSDDEVWELVFGGTLKRSFSVLSDGACPACGKPVVMGEWVIDPFKNPWKVQCPCCGELFPKNDFYRYYLSGLDEKRIFRYELADAALLTDESDPEQKPKTCYDFGIDDGEGAMCGWCTQRRWWFIAAYLVYGQWKQKIVKGLQVLSNAYLLTSDKAYARKAGILLDRIADFFPDYEYRRQGLVYEEGGDDGYVTTWHDSNFEVMMILLAYDAVFDGIQRDLQLVEFLHHKAVQYHVANKKTSFAAVQKNIEERIFRDVLKHSRKVTLNYPGTDTLITAIKVVLDENVFKEDITTCTDTIIRWATKTDGLTGEKGLGGYTSVTTDAMLRFIEILSLKDESIVSEILREYPAVEEAFRFNTDTWFVDKYYPAIGDTGYVGGPMAFFNNFDFIHRLTCNVKSNSTPLLGLNLNTFLWRCYQATKNKRYLDIILKKAGGVPEKERCDIGMADAPAFYAMLEKIKSGGEQPLEKTSFNKQKWHLAALSSGAGETERAVWMHYQGTHAPHGHEDAMNIGLYAKGLDLMPDFGYPPVQYGGWFTDYKKWYAMAAAHNTVVVTGGENSPENASEGKTELWADGGYFKVIRASADGFMGTSRYARTVCMVDVSPRDSYILDCFRVIGGRHHAKFTHSTFGDCSVTGLDLQPAEDFGQGGLLSEFRGQEDANPGWTADWKTNDYYHVLPQKRDIHLKYIELTRNAGGYTAKAWVNAGPTSVKNEAALDVVMTERRQEQPADGLLDSHFIAVLEPYEDSSILGARRLEIQTDGSENGCAAVEVTLAGRRTDVLLLSDGDSTVRLDYKGVKITVKAELCLLRYTEGKLTDAAVCKGNSLTIGEEHADLSRQEEWVQLTYH